MPLDTKAINKISAIALLIFLLVLAFILIKPILLSIIAGLLLAYVVNPVYKRINNTIKRPTLSALLSSLLIIVVIFIPLWFLVPIMIKQVFDMFAFFQGADIRSVIELFFPAAPEDFIRQMTGIASNFVSEISVNVLNWLSSLLLDLPNLLLQGAVLIFVFFFTLKDQDKLKAYVSDLSPLNKDQEKVLIKEFKGITSSVMYGYVVIGIIQGIATGIGLFAFGIPRALVLTIIAIFASMFPLIGPWIIWIPAAAYLFVNGNHGAAIAFTIYGAVVVSSLDNILRPYIVSRRSSISPVIALIGMIGGLFVFGLLGLILGPLILAYLVIFLTAYKNKQLSSMFSK